MRTEPEQESPCLPRLAGMPLRVRYPPLDAGTMCFVVRRGAKNSPCTQESEHRRFRLLPPPPRLLRPVPTLRTACATKAVRDERTRVRRERQRQTVPATT